MKTLAIILMASYLCCLVKGKINFKNNACKSYTGYFFRFINKDCYYDDELFLQTPQILELRNIPYENHTVTTEDGYILSLFRVTKDNPKGIIVMFHPIVEDSTVWFLGGNQSYVTTFMNAGYELWLVNTRGTTYSNRHITQDIGEFEYWDFSFHEVGVYDYSAIFRYINNITNSKLISFSMSIGSTAATIYASEKPEEAKDLIKIFIPMAVPAFMKDSKSLIRIAIPIIPIAKVVQRIFGFAALFHKYRWALKLFAKISLFLNAEWLFGIIEAPFVGGPPLALNPTFLPLGISITPEPVSAKSLYHFAQLLTNGNQFVKYDYGKKKNLQIYQSERPPRYRVEDINVPVYIILGETDNLANRKGNLLLYSRLSEAVKQYGYLEIPNCGHADFLLGKKAPLIAQENTLRLLENF